MKKFLACLIAVLFLFESISVGVPMLQGRLSANAEEAVVEEDEYDEEYEDDESGDEYEYEEDEYDEDMIVDDNIDESDDEVDEGESPIDVLRAAKSRVKSNILARTDSDEFDDDEDLWDEDDDIDDDEYDDEYADDVEMPADQLSEETPQGIRVQAAYGEDVFPENTSMELTDVPKEEVLEAISKVIDDIVDVVAVGITFLDENGEELEPENDGEVEVSLSLNAPLQKGEQTVVHIDDAGNVEEVVEVRIVKATETGAEFVADAFSTYAIVTKTDSSASYQALQADGFVYEILENSELSLHTMPKAENVTVLSTIKDDTDANYTVTKVLGEYDSSGNHTGVGGRNGGQKKITLASTITEIGKEAFAEIKDTNNNYTLQTVSLSKNLKTIGAKAFYGNEKLAVIEIPDAVTTVGENAFANCGMKSVFIPKSVTNIGDHAFGWNDGTNKVAEDFTIYGYAGSAAETYAKKYSITFISVGTATSSSSSSTSATSSSSSTSTTKSSSSSSSDSDDDKDDDDDDSSSSSSSSSFSTGDTKTYSSKSGLNKAEYEKTGSSTVTYNEAKVSSSSKVARVAGTVKISSKTYKVTEVAENAFSGYKNLKKVKIGQYVQALDENMIADCPNLTKLVINSKKLTADNIKNSLKGSNVKKIVVPSGTAKAYEKIFTKAITGSKTELVVKEHPAAKKSTSSTTKTTNSSTKASGSSTSSTTKTTGSSTSSSTTTKTASDSSSGSATTKTTSSSSSGSTGTKKSTSSTNSTAKKTTSKTTGKTTSK